MRDRVGERLERAGEEGAFVLDEIRVQLACRRCSVFLDDPRMLAVKEVDYQDLETLLLTAERLGAQALRRAPLFCTRCGAKTHAVAADYHVFHSAMGRDLVCRVSRRALRHEVELLWWGAGGHLAATPLTERQRFGVRRDALLRAVRCAFDRGGVRACLPFLDRAAQHLRGDADLLRYAPELLGAGEAQRLSGIAEDRVALHPDDPEGHYWLAMARMNGAGDHRQDRTLVEARTHLERALSLRSEFPEAETALGRLRRTPTVQSRAVQLQGDLEALLGYALGR
jgi:hypothetical protein